LVSETAGTEKKSDPPERIVTIVGSGSISPVKCTRWYEVVAHGTKNTYTMGHDLIPVSAFYRTEPIVLRIFIIKPFRWWSSGKSLGPRGLFIPWSQVQAM
jgi:hypothetical protein